MKTSNAPAVILAVLEATRTPLTAQDVVKMLADWTPTTLRNVNRHLLRLVSLGVLQREYVYVSRVGSYVYTLKR